MKGKEQPQRRAVKGGLGPKAITRRPAAKRPAKSSGGSTGQFKKGIGASSVTVRPVARNKRGK